MPSGGKAGVFRNRPDIQPITFKVRSHSLVLGNCVGIQRIFIVITDTADTYTVALDVQISHETDVNCYVQFQGVPLIGGL